MATNTVLTKNKFSLQKRLQNQLILTILQPSNDNYILFTDTIRCGIWICDCTRFMTIDLHINYDLREVHT